MLNLKCVVRLNKDWRSWIEATLIAFVPSKERVRTAAGGHAMDTISTDAIVRLETFNKGSLYQIPIELIKMEYDDA